MQEKSGSEEWIGPVIGMGAVFGRIEAAVFDDGADKIGAGKIGKNLGIFQIQDDQIGLFSGMERSDPVMLAQSECSL